MSETSLGTGQSLTSEQKGAALEAVVHSQTFARADQLKSFLKYVCEMEMAGRGHELTEYLIGTEALGRPAKACHFAHSTRRVASSRSNWPA